MIILALMLVGVGAAVLGITGLQLWEGRSRSRPAPRCAMPAPDGSRVCVDDAGHLGWHHTLRARWFGAVWAPSVPTVRVAAKPKAAVSAMSGGPTKAAASVVESPTLLGGEPLKFRVGAFGTRRPVDFHY